MSATTLRAGVQTFIAGAAIPGLSKVYLNYPWRLQGPALAIDPVRGWGAVCWPHIDHQQEHRLTFPAGTGSKQVDYRIGLLVVFQYRIPQTLPAGSVEDAWTQPHDQLLDALCARLRSDQTLGGIVLQAGETDNGSDSQIAIRRELPKIDGGTLHCWTAIEFGASEIITA